MSSILFSSACMHSNLRVHLPSAPRCVFRPVRLAGGWWLVLIWYEKKCCWLVTCDWFVLREKYCWPLARKQGSRLFVAEATYRSSLPMQLEHAIFQSYPSGYTRPYTLWTWPTEGSQEFHIAHYSFDSLLERQTRTDQLKPTWTFPLHFRVRFHDTTWRSDSASRSTFPFHQSTVHTLHVFLLPACLSLSTASTGRNFPLKKSTGTKKNSPQPDPSR
jgi:hypothetical protein